MTKEIIEGIRKIVVPFVKKRLFEINYEGLGESDAKEFDEHMNEILDLATKALEQEPETGHWITKESIKANINDFLNELEAIFSDIREKNVDDSVCGLCEYDCDHGLDGCANECPGFERDDCFKLKEEYRNEWINKIIGEVKS